MILIMYPLFTYVPKQTTKINLTKATINSPEWITNAKSTYMKINTPSAYYIEKNAYTRQTPFTINVLFDEAHGQYFDSSKLSMFLDDLKQIYDVNLTINSDKTLTSDYLSQFDILIMPNPQGGLTEDEIMAIKNFIKNGGIVFLMGDRYNYYHVNLTKITDEFGIEWINCTVYDETNYDYRYYYPLIHTWTNTTVAIFLSKDKTLDKVKTGGNMLKIIGENDTTKTIYIIGTGDSDTYIEFPNGTQKTLGTNIIVFAAVDIIGGGRLFLSHSSSFLRDSYNYDPYYGFDNREFALRVMHWLFAEGLEIVNYEIPAEPILSGEYAYLNVTIRNNAETTATDVWASIELDGAVELVNISDMVYLGNLTSGEERTICWVVKSTGTSTVKVKFKVWSKNALGFSVADSFRTLGLVVTASLLYNWTVLTNWNWTMLTVNISNPTETGINATNVNVSIHISCFFGNVTTENESWEYTITELPYGSYKVLTWKLFASNFEMRENVEIRICVESNELGTAETRVVWMIFTDKFVIFDQGHGQYWDSERLSIFIFDIYGALYFKRSFGNLFINNGSFTKELLGNATAIILPNVEGEMTPEEVSLLHDFINSGGRLLIMAEWYKWFKEEQAQLYNNITGRYGITWNVGEIMDNESKIEQPYYPILTKKAFANNSIAKAVLFGVDKVFFPSGTFLTIDPNKAVPILHGNPSSYTVNASGSPTGINGTDIVAMAAYYNETTGALIIASGSSKMFSNVTIADTTPAKENAFLLFKIALTLLLYPDTELPTIQITAPENDTWFNTKTVTVSWLGLDNVMIAMYEVYVDGTLEVSLPMINMSYTLTLDEGHHTIQIRAYDWCGNSASDEIVVHVDITPPSITITSPKFEETFEMDGSVSVKVEWNASDNLALDHFVIYLNGTEVDEVNSTVHTYTLTLNETGAYYIKVEAWDKAGNSAYSEVLIYVKPKPVTPVWIYITIGVVVVAVIAVAVFLLKRKGRV